MNCKGCGKPVSEYGDRVMPEPDEFWHGLCWLKVDWHVDALPQPRPMTQIEKHDELERLRRAEDERLWGRVFEHVGGLEQSPLETEQ